MKGEPFQMDLGSDFISFCGIKLSTPILLMPSTLMLFIPFMVQSTPD